MTRGTRGVLSHTSCVASVLAVFVSFAAAAEVPTVPLSNAARAGMTMPITGLGTGGYGNNASVGYGGYPECWNDAAGCGPWVKQAVSTYIKLAAAASTTQVRIDGGNTYADIDNVGLAIVGSGVPRERIFFLSKTGNGQAMGYADTLAQVDTILTNGSVAYVDALLIHWPTSTGKSVEPACQTGTKSYDAKACRLATWRAYVEVFNAGKARSIGVSNYNATHLQEIKDAGMPLPAINQIPFNIYRSSSWAETTNWCLRNGVVVNSYSPFGVPDLHVFPAAGGMAATPLVDPVVQAIAAAHGRAPAEVLSNWLWRLQYPFNPRSMSAAHMAQNLASFDFQLTGHEVSQLSSRPQDWCEFDAAWYECATAKAD